MFSKFFIKSVDGALVAFNKLAVRLEALHVLHSAKAEEQRIAADLAQAEADRARRILDRIKQLIG